MSRPLEIVIVGAGPAGIAAACCAAESGGRVTLIDSSPAPGGQIWRGAAAQHSASAATWFARFHAAPVTPILGREVIGLDAPRILRIADAAGRAEQIHYDKLILASGARELFLPIPGWTLPGFFGAGGLQALVKSGLSVDGKKVVVAGSGPLLLAVAAMLLREGAQVACIVEQAPWWRVLRFGSYLLRNHFSKFREGVRLRRSLKRVPFYTGRWLRAVHGSDRVESVTITDGRKDRQQPCDYVACGFGLVPNLELPLLLGCNVIKHAVAVDMYQCTNTSDVLCAGELTGIAGLDAALVEGQIAGYAATGQRAKAQALFAARERHRQFAARLNSTFPLRGELREMADAKTIVCRCEDIPLGNLREFQNWREAKLQSRCGMGPCQGRVCGPACEWLFGWHVESIRPPIFPCRVQQLSAPVVQRST